MIEILPFRLAMPIALAGSLAAATIVRAQEVPPPPPGPSVFAEAHTTVVGNELFPECDVAIEDLLTAGDYEGVSAFCSIADPNNILLNWQCDGLHATSLSCPRPETIFVTADTAYRAVGLFGLFGFIDPLTGLAEDPLDYGRRASEASFTDWAYRIPDNDGVHEWGVNPFDIEGIVETVFVPVIVSPTIQEDVASTRVPISANQSVTWELFSGSGQLSGATETGVTYVAPPPPIANARTAVIEACSTTTFHDDDCAMADVDVVPLDVSVSAADGLTEILPGNTVQLTADVTPSAIDGKAVNQVTWQVTAGGTAGTVDSEGVFHALNVTVPTLVAVRACSTLDSSRCATIELSVPLATVTVQIAQGFPSRFTAAQDAKQDFTATVDGVTDPRNRKVFWQLVQVPGSPNIGPIASIADLVGELTVTSPPTTAGAVGLQACAASNLLDQQVCSDIFLAPYVPLPKVSPGSISLNPGAQQQFSSIPNVSWSIAPAGLGSIDQTGLYTAPPPPNDNLQIVTINACFNSPPNPCGIATVTLLPSPDFSVTAVPPQAQTLTPGVTATYTIDVTPLNGFTGTVNLSIGASPAGITPTISPAAVSLNGSAATVTVTVPTAGVPLLPYTITVTGTTQPLGFKHVVNLSLSVVDFTIGATPASVTASGGATATYTVTTGALNGFAFPVCLGVTGQPAGVTPSFNPSCITGAGTSTLSLPIASTTQVGSYSLAITGTSTAGGGPDAHQVSPSPTLIVVPTVGSLSPSSGPTGTSVTISGANFGSAQNGSTLTFGGVPATSITTWSSTSIVATVPVGVPAGPSPVVVTVNGIASNHNVAFTVVPSITTLSPTIGPINTQLTITGTSFGAAQGGSTVTFAGLPSTSTISWSDGSVTILVPANLTPGVYAVVITVNGTPSNPPGVTAPTFTVVPLITSISPATGAAGAVVTIAGNNFGAAQGSSTVTFNGTAGTPTTWSNTSIVVPVPSGLQPGPATVVVTNVFPSNGAAFAVTPGITTMNPTFGPVGTQVTIAGTSFGATQGNGTVTFNGIAATVDTWSNGTLTVVVPAGATTGNVVVTAGGAASSGLQFIVTAPSTFFLTTASSAVSGLMTLGSSVGSAASLASPDLAGQPAGDDLIQAFDTAVGVPGSSNTWPAGLAGTFTVWMAQTAGATGTLFPEVMLFLDSQTGTPICSVIGSTALTTTNTQYSLGCAPAANVTLAPTDQYYLWVGVHSTAAASSSEKAQAGVGIQVRGRPASSVTVPIQ